MVYLLFLFSFIVNLISFTAFGIDKYLARSKRRRISEKTLLRLAAFGGSAGAVIGSRLFRHKTQKFKGMFAGMVIVHTVLLAGAAWLYLSRWG
ncbi:MAG: DUF1294 domain-containing protein [Sulfuricurvum sp.]